MRNNKRLRVKQLDKKLNGFIGIKDLNTPEKGWIHTTRTALNMSMSQLASKLSMTRQGVQKIEESESKGSISLNSLQEVANAMDFKVVYAIIPKQGTVDALVQQKATQLAKKIVLRAHHTMQLENQAIEDASIRLAIEELAADLAREMSKSLWD